MSLSVSVHSFVHGIVLNYVFISIVTQAIYSLNLSCISQVACCMLHGVGFRLQVACCCLKGFRIKVIVCKASVLQHKSLIQPRMHF